METHSTVLSKSLREQYDCYCLESLNTPPRSAPAAPGAWK